MSATDPQKATAAPSKSMELGRFTAEGATSMFFSKVAQQLVSVIGSVVLIRLLVNPTVYAYIALAITVPGLVMLGNFLGIGSGLTRYLSMYRGRNDSEGIWSAFWTGLPISAGIGAGVSVIAYFAASPMSFLIDKQTELLFFQLASPLPFVWVLQLSVKATLLSLGRSKVYSAYQVVDEILISSFPIAAVLLGYGVVGALVGMVVANYVSLSIALSITISSVFASTQKGKRKVNFVSSAKTLTSYGLPLGLANNYSTFAGQVANLVIARFVSLDIYGLYSVASSASVFATYVTDPVNSMISPMFARINGLENRELLRTVYRQAVRYSSLLYFPLALFFVIFSRPFLVLFFGQTYSGGAIYLTILSGVGLAYGLGYITTYSLLASQGYSKFSGSMSMLTSTVGMIAAIAVIPTLGFIPFLFASALSFLPSFALILRKAKLVYSLSPPFPSVRLLYLATLLTAVVSVPLLLIPMPELAEVVIGLLVTCTAYTFFVIVIRAVTSSDIKNLQSMLSTQSIVARVVDPFFKLFNFLERNLGSGD